MINAPFFFYLVVVDHNSLVDYHRLDKAGVDHNRHFEVFESVPLDSLCFLLFNRKRKKKED